MEARGPDNYLAFGPHVQGAIKLSKDAGITFIGHIMKARIKVYFLAEWVIF